MSKVLLVEDDNNLREIYEARLQAEGYAIVSAKDGEEALVLAKQEHPDLIISDVMMPNISGFEMLDILRNTEGLKDTKVIMLTALGQAEDKTRADSLGADRYLVKSQVTLEDIVKAAQELLSPAGANPAPAATPAPVVSTPAPSAAAPTIPVAAAPVPVPVFTPPKAASPALAPTVAAPAAPAPVVPGSLPAPPSAAPSPPPLATSSVPLSPTSPPPTPTPPQAHPAPAAAPSTTLPSAPKPPENLTQSTSNEEAVMKAQIDSFVKGEPEESPPAVTPPVPHGELSKEPENLSPKPAPAAAAPPAPPKLPEPSSPPQTASAPAASTATPSNNPPAPAPVAPPVAAQAPPNNPPAPSSDQLVANAVNDLVSSTTAPPNPSAPAVDSTAPAPPPQPPAEEPAPAETTSSDGVNVAHKKVIKPIDNLNADARPGLDELLAREGISDINNLPHPPATPLNTAQTPSYQTPHPPGHIIAPSDKTNVDPNSIAL